MVFCRVERIDPAGDGNANASFLCRDVGDRLSVLPDETGITSVGSAGPGAPVIALPVSTLKVVGRGRQGQGRGVGRRRTSGSGVSVDTCVLGQSLAVGSLPSFRVSGKSVSAGKVVLKVVRLVVFLPSGKTTEVSRRGLSGGPDYVAEGASMGVAS